MNFSELESLMSSRGVTTLADIARTLNTTPQAVSNWKARDQVPYRIVSKIAGSENNKEFSVQNKFIDPPSKDTLTIFDILLTLSEHLKVIFLVPFVFIFITFTYVQFLQQPTYLSWATILLPGNNSGNAGGIAGLASQFGVNVPSQPQIDLSSPSLLPELLRSNVFADQLLNKKFYTQKHNVELTLLSILTDNHTTGEDKRQVLIAKGRSMLKSMLEFDKDGMSTFNIIKVSASEPKLARDLAVVVLQELEKLNRYYKNVTVSEKTTFIKSRIAVVGDDLALSEKRLQSFREQNRQASSPALRLESDRLNRDVEVQKGIYLTLKQQLELTKIEEIQGASILQVLDKPQVPLGPVNKNLTLSTVIAGTLGLFLSIFIGFFRSYLRYSNKSDRLKMRRIRNFLKKKGKDIVFDRRISGVVSITLIMGLPYYLGYKSENPEFFGRYSSSLMIINILYISFLITSVFMFIYSTKKNKD